MRENWTNLLRNTLLVMIVLILTACADGGDETVTENEAQDTEVNTGDLVVESVSGPVSLDPHTSSDLPSSHVQAPIYEGLTQMDADGKIIPSLAESWKTLDDTTWEFKLREGVKFHDGEDFNAEAAKINFDRMLDSAIGSPNAFVFEMISNIEVVDEYVLKIETTYPFGPLPAYFNHSGGVMISPKSIEADYAAVAEGELPGATINEKPVGTGYLTFDTWTPGVEVILTKNEAYWGELAAVDSITFKTIPESTTRLAELKGGYAHIIDAVQPTEVPELSDSEEGDVDIKNSTSLSYIGFNTQKKPFDDVRVRQAITMLTNREEILEGVYDGFGSPAVGPLAPGVFGYNEGIEPITYDPEQAKELLEAAGYADGFDMTLWTNDHPQRKDTAIIVQEALKEANINVEIEVFEWGAYLDHLSNGKHDMFIMGLWNPVGDADYFLMQLFHSSNVGTGNRSFFDNAQVDELLEAARQEIDETKRLELYKEVEEIIIAEAPAIFVHHQAYLRGVSNKVTGYEFNPAGFYDLHHVKFVE